ncbi:hypothetical protein BC833DRAFT_617013 [Globomyces pollinis-pini]|nr:hypothetical protein BC833DRAFT_617013 [Globomyces pollinis-pini]
MSIRKRNTSAIYKELDESISHPKSRKNNVKLAIAGVCLFAAGITAGSTWSKTMINSSSDLPVRPNSPEYNALLKQNAEFIELLEKQRDRLKNLNYLKGGVDKPSKHNINETDSTTAANEKPFSFIKKHSYRDNYYEDEIIKPPTGVTQPEIEPDVTLITPMEILPDSSVWCHGTTSSNRFKRTVQVNVPMENRYQENLLELSSIDNHPYFAWNYVEVSPFQQELMNIPVRYEKTTHFMFKRLHPYNIMHNLHDDVLNLFHLIKEYNGKPSEPGRMELPFSLFAHRLLLLDEYGATGSTRPFQYLTNHPLRFSSYLKQKDHENTITCFRDAIVGNTKLTKWYQYGFNSPQGPIDTLPNGMLIREVSEWFAKRQGLHLGYDEHYPNLPWPETGPPKPDNSHLDIPETNLIVIMSRKGNRLILNEDTLVIELTKRYGLKTVFVRNEDQNFEEQIQILRKARVVIGMHGSILVMAMFCRRGTVLIEMYPYAVPSDHYTPYKTMSNLHGMDLVYRAWENKHISNSVAHPDRHELHGGINHLSKQVQEEVINTHTVPQHKCCKSPFWLYRIYQDTIVDINELSALIDDALHESRTVVLKRLRSTDNMFKADITPSPVKTITCLHDEGNGRPSGTLWAEWEPAWTGYQVDKWNVLVNNDGREYKTNSNHTSIAIHGYNAGETLRFFVRPVINGTLGPWSDMGTCTV